MIRRFSVRKAARYSIVFIAGLFINTLSYSQTVRILFDASKGETAGNADWTIDADQTTLGVGSGGAYTTSSGHQSNPQQVPTPAQSTVTTTTPETYWYGALSSWGIDCVNKGYAVETLPWNGQITYNNAANPQDLSHYHVYVVDEPNLVFTADEKTAIMQFVQNGGSLFMISDHNISDRNGDGWDSPNIWNDFLNTNSIQPNPFGFTFDLNDFSQTTTNVSAAATDSIIHGPMGTVTKVKWSGGTTMTLNPAANASVKGVIFKTGTVPGNTNAMVAYARYGNGKVAAIGDSSPTDDGTGNPICTLYNGYWGDASGNHRLLLMNITIWLAGGGTEGISNITSEDAAVSVFPNPSTGMSRLATNIDLTNASVIIYDVAGSEVMHETMPRLSKGAQFSLSLPKGFYLVRMESDQLVQTVKVIVY